MKSYILTITRTDYMEDEEVVFETEIEVGDKVSDQDAAKKIVKIAYHGMTDED